MTQTVWGDDICPVRERELLNAAPLNIVLQEHRERDGRRDLWAESKVNNYNIVSHFFGAQLKKDHLSHLIGNFLCLLRITSHVVAVDAVVRRGTRQTEREEKITD